MFARGSFDTRVAYTALLAATAVERLVELAISRRNAASSFARGGRESGRGHFPFMVALHTGLLAGAAAEVWLLDRPFVPALGAAMLALALAAQGLRWWCIATLGPRWNTRVIVVPGLPLVGGGPYRWLNHPNYVAVALEGLALPLVHSAWITAAAFTALNAPLMAVRIACENRAMTTLSDAEIREAIAAIARDKLKFEGPLPAGELSERLDSLARLTLVVELEDRFGVSLDDAEDEIRTIDDVVRVIRERANART